MSVYTQADHVGSTKLRIYIYICPPGESNFPAEQLILPLIHSLSPINRSSDTRLDSTTSTAKPVNPPINMGCASSKPHRNVQYSTPCQCHHHYHPIDKKTQKRYQKACKKQTKRDRRNKYAAVTTAGAITSYSGYVLYHHSISRSHWMTGSDDFDRGGAC